MRENDPEIKYLGYSGINTCKRW